MQKKIIKFIAVGSINTLLTYTIYVILLSTLSYKISYLVAYTAGIFFVYLLNTFFVFNSNPQRKILLIYFFVYFLNYLGCTYLMGILVGNFKINPVYAPLFVIVLSSTLLFIIFNKASKS